MDLHEACQSQAELKREVTRVLEAVIALGLDSITLVLGVVAAAAVVFGDGLGLVLAVLAFFA
ncbi:MAG: hypothetical protein ACXVIF_06455 [Halobacteriota archaeon]